MKYTEQRPYIQTGDAILWQGKGFISWMIKRWSKYSHASLVVRLEKYEGLSDRIFLVEALTGGLELRLLSKRLEGYAGKAFHFKPNIKYEQREQIRIFALEKCAEGSRYDYRSLFKNMLGRVSMDARRYFCSEFVWASWIDAGIVHLGPDNKAPRPGDIPEWINGNLTEIEI